jgi:hypothetical protein
MPLAGDAGRAVFAGLVKGDAGTVVNVAAADVHPAAKRRPSMKPAALRA